MFGFERGLHLHDSDPSQPQSHNGTVSDQSAEVGSSSRRTKRICFQVKNFAFQRVR